MNKKRIEKYMGKETIKMKKKNRKLYKAQANT